MHEECLSDDTGIQYSWDESDSQKLPGLAQNIFKRDAN
jgi:hypothetical protein